MSGKMAEKMGAQERRIAKKKDNRKFQGINSRDLDSMNRHLYHLKNTFIDTNKETKKKLYPEIRKAMTEITKAHTKIKK